MKEFRLTLLNKGGVEMIVFMHGEDKYEAWQRYRELSGFQERDTITGNIYPMLYTIECV